MLSQQTGAAGGNAVGADTDDAYTDTDQAYAQRVADYHYASASVLPPISNINGMSLRSVSDEVGGGITTTAGNRGVSSTSGGHGEASNEC